MTTSLISRRNLRRTASLRRQPLLEGLEARALFHAIVIDGVDYGTVNNAPPVGGYTIAPVSTKKSSGKSDLTANVTAPGFQIELVYTGGLSASQQAIFAQAALRWQQIVTADLADVGAIDDLQISAGGTPGDGVNGILGSAGPTGLRNSFYHYLPYQGAMNFDTFDLDSLESRGLLDEVVTHEMGHVLGIGTLWSTSFQSYSTDPGGADPRFTGTNAQTEWDRLAATNTLAPIANEGGPGTRDGHWREAGAGALGNELMTGVINSLQANPLSRISAASLIDIGYTGINVDAADLYTVPVSPNTGSTAPADFTAVNPLPVVGALNASATTVAAGSTFTLTLGSASDNGSVGAVRFYRESNGIDGLQASGTVAAGYVASDTLLATRSGAQALTVDVSGLAPGTYTFYARASDDFGALSAVASRTVTVVSVVTPPTPAAPTLLASNDTGSSGSDRITKLNVLTFTGTTSTNATVTLTDSVSGVVGTATADSSGNYSVTTSALGDGGHSFTVVASNSAGSSAASPATTVTIDTQPPTVSSTVYDRNVTQALKVTLSTPLGNAVTSGMVTLQNVTNSTIANVAVSVDGSGTILTLQPSARLADGNYRLTVPAASVTDIAGNTLAAAYTFVFRQLAGDANDSGTVDFNDLTVLAQNYNLTGRNYSQGNFNYSADGLVDFGDLVVLSQSYNHTLPPLPASIAAPATVPGPAATAAPTVAAPASPATATKKKATTGGNAAAVVG